MMLELKAKAIAYDKSPQNSGRLWDGPARLLKG